jgi:hypothetical protein
LRESKIKLIESINPDWRELYLDIYAGKRLPLYRRVPFRALARLAMTVNAGFLADGCPSR